MVRGKTFPCRRNADAPHAILRVMANADADIVTNIPVGHRVGVMKEEGHYLHVFWYQAGKVDTPQGYIASENVKKLKQYTDVDSVMQTILTGEVAPLRGTYIKHLCEAGEPLQRRQDLPDEAFFTYDHLVFIREKLHDYFENLGR